MTLEHASLDNPIIVRIKEDYDKKNCEGRIGYVVGFVKGTEDNQVYVYIPDQDFNGHNSIFLIDDLERKGYKTEKMWNMFDDNVQIMSKEDIYDLSFI